MNGRSRMLVSEVKRQVLEEVAATSKMHAPPPVSADRFCKNLVELSAATGIPKTMLQSIKRAARGKPDYPFRGHGSYPSWIKQWLMERPDFGTYSEREGFPRHPSVGNL